MVWANHLEDAIDEAIDWVADHAPGNLMDEQVHEAYQRAISQGLSEEQALQVAEEDVFSGGNSGHYVASDELNVVAENPTRECVLRLQGRV